MKLIGVDCQIPSNKIFNGDIIDLVKFYSSSFYSGNIKDLESMVKRFLNFTGINSRFWRNEKEKPIELIINATERSLRMANLTKNEIDLVIYSSIDRGFIEPANASFICKSLGINKTRCFDIVDGCMGWCSALQTAQAFMKNNSLVRNVMLINSEFPMDRIGSVLPNNFTINNIKELDWKAPSFTLGEATSVCILQNDESPLWLFEFIENAEYADLCNIPILNFEKYVDDDKNHNFYPGMQFYSLGSELLKKGMDLSLEVLNSLLGKLDYTPELIFPHSVSNKIIKEAAAKANVDSSIYSTFVELGNIATVSIPSSINKAMLNGRFKDNQKAIGWIASAGMKFSAFEIQI